MANNSDIDILLAARLDVDDTAGIKSDISTLSKKIKDTPVDLQVKLSNTDLSALKKEIADIQKSLSIDTKTNSLLSLDKSTLSQLDSATKSFRDIQSIVNDMGGTLTKKTEIFDEDDLENAKKTILEINQGVGQTLKITESQGKEFAFTTNKLQAQKEIYSELNKLAKEESQLSQRVSTSRGEEQAQAQKMLDINRQQQTSVRAIINDNKELFYNKQLEENLHKNIDSLLDKQLLKQAQINQKELERIDILGQKIEGGDLSTFDMADENNLDNMSKYLQNLTGIDMEVTKVEQAHSKFRSGMKDTSKQVYELTAVQKLSNDKMREFKIVADESSNSLYRLGDAVKPLPNKFMSIVSQMGEAIIKSGQWAVAMDMVYGNLRRLKEGIEIVKQLDSELSQIATTLGVTRQEAQSYADTIVSTAIDLRKSVKDVSAVTTELVRQGLSLEESQKRMEVIMKMSTVGKISTTDSVKIITSAVNALGEEAEKTADVLLKTGNITASSAEQIGEAFTRTASAARANGMEIEQLSALLGTLVEVTQESPASLGNSLKSLVARFSKINEETGELNKDLNQVSQAFTAVGISFTDVDGQIRPFYDLLQDLSSVWGDLDKNTQNYISTQAAGVMQSNRFIAIMDNFNRVQEVNNQIMDSSGTLAKGYDTMLDSIASKANRAKASFEGMWVDTINSDTIGLFYDLSFIVTQVLDKIGLLNVVIVGLAATLKYLYTSGKMNVDVLTKFNATLMANGVVAKQNIADTLRMIQAEGLLATVKKKLTLETVKQKVAIMGVSTAEKKATLLTSLLAAAKIGLGTATTFAAGAIRTLGLALKALTPYLLPLLALEGAMFLFDLAKSFFTTSESATEATNSIMELNNAISEHSSNVKTLKNITEEYKQLTVKMGEMKDITNLTADEQERYNSIMDEIEQIMPNYVTYVGDANTKMLLYGKTLDDVIEKEKEKVELNKEMLTTGQEALAIDLEKNEKELEKKQKKLDNALIELDVEKTEKKAEKVKKLKSELMELKSTNDEIKSSQEQSLNILMQDLDNIEGVSKRLVDVAKGSILEMFEKEGFMKASSSVSDFVIILEESTKMLDRTGTEFNYATDASDELKDAFARLGMNTGDINNLLFELATNLGIVKDGFEGLTTVLAPDMESIKKLQESVKTMGDMYKKLAGGSQLSTDEYDTLINDYEEIANYIAETGDLTLKNGELLNSIWVESNSNLREQLNIQKEANTDAIKKVEGQLSAKRKELSALDTTTENGQKKYAKLNKEVADLQDLLVSNNRELAKTNAQFSALENLNLGESKVLGLDVSIQQMENAEKMIDSYNSILEKMSEDGGMTIEVYRTIIKEHPELMGVLDDEVAMRELINQKIAEMKDTAIDSYKGILMYNDSFYKKMLGSNSELFNKIADMYQVNLGNFSNMNELMMGIAASSASQIAKAYDIQVSIPRDIANNVNYSELEMKQKSVSRTLARTETSLENRSLLDFGGKMQDKKTIKNAKEQLQILNNALAVENQRKQTEKDINALMQSEATESYPKISLPSSTMSKTSSGGGGGSSKASKVSKIDIESNVNMYKRWEQAITKVNDALEMTDLFMERASDKDKISLAEKENKLLKEKQVLLGHMNKQYKNELQTLSETLTKRGINVESATYGIAEIENVVKSTQVEIDKLTSQINSIGSSTSARESLVTRRDDLKDDIDDLIKEFDRYIEVTNIISEKSNEWWQIQSEILDNQIKKFESGLEKYTEKLNMINQQISLIGGIREDRPSEVEREIELLQIVIETTRETRSSINNELYNANQRVKELEKTLQSFGNVRNEQYQETYNQLTLARALSKNIMDEFMEATVNLSTAMQNATDKRIEALNHERDEMIKTIDTLLEMEDIYNNRTLVTEGRDIQHRIDLLNKQFKENVYFRLDTSGIERDLNNINSYYKNLKKKYDKMKSESTVETEIDFEKESIENSKEKIKLLDESLKKQADLIILNKEEAERLSEEIEDLSYQYKEIEASLQNRIDLKEEELTLLKEQHKREEKVSQQIEKQLELLRALDDRRYSYITGTGEEVFTYDVAAVNKLKQEMSKLREDERKQKAEEQLADEISKLKEDLAKTVEINQLDIEIRKLQLTALEENTSAMEKLLEGTKEDYETVYENLSNQLIDEWKKTMSAMVESHETLYKEYLARQSYDAPTEIFRHQGLGSKDYVSFDSGGYTGDFEGGKLAMLHEKELILNKQDTKNVLETFNIAKEMGKQLLSRKVTPIEKNNEQNGNLYVENVNLPSVKDGKSFVNELQGLLRRGQNRLV